MFFPTHKILEKEGFWVRHYPDLLSLGYQLRPRYHPDWKPPPIDVWSDESEDRYGIMDSQSHIIDAVRVKDGQQVVLRKPRGRSELEVLSLLHSLPSSHNRTVPIIETLTVGGETVIVMPLLREFDAPPFERRSECIEAIQQILQGLVFMHTNNIAHADACALNVMMDASDLIPGGFSLIQNATGLNAPKKFRSRKAVGPMAYFFIDFETASIYPHGPGSFKSRRIGPCGQDKTAPEFKPGKLCTWDPFFLDIYQVGHNIIQERFLDRYEGLEFLEPLVEQMTRAWAKTRPSATDALETFRYLVAALKREHPGVWAQDRIIHVEDGFRKRLKNRSLNNLSRYSRLFRRATCLCQ